MTDPGGIRHYDVTDPEDMRELVETGLIWHGGPRSIEEGKKWLQANTDADLSEVPQDILDELGLLDDDTDFTEDEMSAPDPLAEL